MLVAVPVCVKSSDPGEGWYYELSIVTIHCDEDYFSVDNSDGDPWGWDLTSVDFFVRL